MTSRAAESGAPIRIVFLGTPTFAVPTLRALLADPGLIVPLVVTQPDRPSGRGRRLAASPVKAVAEERGIPVFQPERLRGPEAVERLRAASPDLLVIAAYGQILRQAVLDLPRHGCLNVHPSLLPRHRGPAPIPAAILAGEERTGVTIMLTDRGMDTGPLLTQERMAIDPDDTADTLGERLALLGGGLLVRTIRPWLAGQLVPRTQDEAAATVTRTFTRADGAIDWSRSAPALERQVRALNPWPRAYTFDRGKRLLILRARAVEARGEGTGEGQGETAALPPGTVFAGAADGLCVATGLGALRLDEVQPEGRRPLVASVYRRGTPAIIGTRLESEFTVELASEAEEGVSGDATG